MSWPTDERLNTLRERVEEQEQELHVALEELQGVARRTFDVRRWIRSQPGLWIGGALLAGIWLGTRAHANREG
jgi:hypothetical protein